MKLRGRLDRNHAEIVSDLRTAGASVQSLANIGDGCPDILVARAGAMYLMEIKDGNKQLTAQEVRWHQSWQAPVFVVHSSEEALRVIGLG
jgi:soluble P-type ATPase